jgi:Bacteriophage baseplate protein W
MAKDIIGRGWAFPVKPGLDQHLHYTGGEEKIRQSIWIILGTAPGERQMLPEFGCGIHDMVHRPNATDFRGMLAEKVRTALVRWEPRIDILDVRVEDSPEARNCLYLNIDYRIRTNNAFYNLVYPFFITEGAG